MKGGDFIVHYQCKSCTWYKVDDCDGQKEFDVDVCLKNKAKIHQTITKTNLRRNLK